MEAKEKAKEIFDKFEFEILDRNGLSPNDSVTACAKAIAIIAVDQVLELAEGFCPLWSIEYWNQVKQEIEKL